MDREKESQRLFNEDGIFVEFFQTLWAKDEFNFGPSINLPDTITFRYGQPNEWYFTSSSGKIKKKSKQNLLSAKIEEYFNKNNLGYDVIAIFISISLDRDPVTFDLLFPPTIRYLDRNDLSEFLYDGKKTVNGILQRFIEPKGVKNDVIRAIWSPKLCLLERAENIHNLHDKRFGMYERCVTFEGPEYFYTSSPLRGPVLAGQLQKICESIISHISEVSFGQKSISRMVVNFKVDSREKIWLLFSTSMRCHDDLHQQMLASSSSTSALASSSSSSSSASNPPSLLHTPQNEPSTSHPTTLPRKLINFDPSLYLPSHITLNPTISHAVYNPENTKQIHLKNSHPNLHHSSSSTFLSVNCPQPKGKLTCLSCAQESLEDLFFPVPYKSIIKHYQHVLELLKEMYFSKERKRHLLMTANSSSSSSSSSSSHRNPNSSSSTSNSNSVYLFPWPPERTIIELGGGVGFGCVFLANQGNSSGGAGTGAGGSGGLGGGSGNSKQNNNLNFSNSHSFSALASSSILTTHPSSSSSSSSTSSTPLKQLKIDLSLPFTTTSTAGHSSSSSSSSSLSRPLTSTLSSSSLHSTASASSTSNTSSTTTQYSSHLPIELVVPPLLLHLHPRLTHESYHSCQKDPIFLFKTVNLCENCYLVYAEFATMMLRLGKNMKKLLSPHVTFQSTRRGDEERGGGRGGLDGESFYTAMPSSPTSSYLSPSKFQRSKSMGGLREDSDREGRATGGGGGGARPTSADWRAVSTLQRNGHSDQGHRPPTHPSHSQKHHSSLPPPPRSLPSVPSTIFRGGEAKEASANILLGQLSSHPLNASSVSSWHTANSYNNPPTQSNDIRAGEEETTRNMNNNNYNSSSSSSDTNTNLIAERERHFYKEISQNPHLQDQHPLLHLLTAQEKMKAVEEMSGVMKKKFEREKAQQAMLASFSGGSMVGEGSTSMMGGGSMVGGKKEKEGSTFVGRILPHSPEYYATQSLLRPPSSSNLSSSPSTASLPPSNPNPHLHPLSRYGSQSTLHPLPSRYNMYGEEIPVVHNQQIILPSKLKAIKIKEQEEKKEYKKSLKMKEKDVFSRTPLNSVVSSSSSFASSASDSSASSNNNSHHESNSNSIDKNHGNGNDSTGNSLQTQIGGMNKNKKKQGNNNTMEEGADPSLLHRSFLRDTLQSVMGGERE